MTRLFFEPDSRDAYLRLREDPHRGDLLEAARQVLDLISADPGDAAVRERRFDEGLWGTRVRGKAEDWIILWREGPADSDSVVVRYVGPDTLE